MSNLIEQIAVASEVRHRDGRYVVAERIYEHVVKPLEAKCAALAAENAALKSFGGKLAEIHNDLNGEGTGIQGRAEVACQQVALEAAMEEFDAIETPATDSFLAEVREQGVEMFAQWCIGERDFTLIDEDMSDAAAYEECVKRAEYFATQLRQEAQ